MKEILADTGPLVAYLDRSDRDHAWAREVFSGITRPLLTCEAVIAEALFLLRRGGIQPDGLLDLIRRGLLVPEFDLAQEIEAKVRSSGTLRTTEIGEIGDALLICASSYFSVPSVVLSSSVVLPQVLLTQLPYPG